MLNYRLTGEIKKKKAFISVGLRPTCLMFVWRNHIQGDRKRQRGGEQTGGWVLTIWGHYRATSGPRRWRETLYLNSPGCLTDHPNPVSCSCLQRDCNRHKHVSLDGKISSSVEEADWMSSMSSVDPGSNIKRCTSSVSEIPWRNFLRICMKSSRSSLCEDDANRKVNISSQELLQFILRGTWMFVPNVNPSRWVPIVPTAHNPEAPTVERSGP